MSEIKRLEMVSRNMHVDAPRMREDVRVAIDLLEQADAVMAAVEEDDIAVAYLGGVSAWRERYKQAKGE